MQKTVEAVGDDEEAACLFDKYKDIDDFPIIRMLGFDNRRQGTSQSEAWVLTKRLERQASG